MYLFHISQYTIQNRNVNISVMNDALRDAGQVHCGISKLGFFAGSSMISHYKWLDRRYCDDKLLAHWGRVTRICISRLTIIDSDNGLSPGRRQAIIWTSDGILLIGPWGTNFSEIIIKMEQFLFKKMYLKMSFWKMAAILYRPQCVKRAIR